MPAFSASYCLCCLDNRWGCLIIVFLETCWYGSNFYLCLRALHKAVHDWIMRLDYYRQIVTDEWAIIFAAVGLGASVLAFLFTFFLAFVAYRHGRLKFLLVPYVCKNIVVISLETVIFHKRWLERYQAGEETAGRTYFAFIFTSTAGILFPLYSIYVVYFYYAEIKAREAIARKLYVAWSQRMKIAENLRDRVRDLRTVKKKKKKKKKGKKKRKKAKKKGKKKR